MTKVVLTTASQIATIHTLGHARYESTEFSVSDSAVAR